MNKGFIFLIAFTLVVFSKVNAESDTIKAAHEGEILFRTHCASCHHIHKELTGPMLASITKKRPQDWLLSFIKNSQNVILSKDEYANFLFEKYNRTVMPPFEQLSETEIKSILQFIETESKVVQKQVDESFNGMPGKALFRNHCSSCHFLNFEGYGPSLGSVYKRRRMEWLVRFVSNSQKVIGSGDPYANFVYSKFNQKVMPPFSFLDSQSIVSIIEYIGTFSQSSSQIAGVNGLTIEKDRKVVPHSSFEFFNEEQAFGTRGLFGKIAMGVAGCFALYIFLRILRMVYKSFFK